MKYSLFIVFLVSAVAISNATLADDIKELEALIPKSKIVLIAGKHLVFDKEFRNFKNFLSTPEFAKIWETAMRNSEFRIIVQYVEESGADMIGILNSLAKMLKLAEYPKEIKFVDIRPRTLMSFIDEVMGAMPKGDMSNLMKQKMQTSPEFKRLHDRLVAPEFHQLVLTAKNCAGLASPVAALKSKGLNIDRLLEIGQDVLTWAK